MMDFIKYVRPPKIGMRILKSALAVFVCFVLSDLFKRDYAFYSAIAALLCMQPHIKLSWSFGVARGSGAVLGGAVGVLTVRLIEAFPGTPEVAQYLIICAAIVAIIYFTVLIRYTDMAYISCVVFLSVVIFHSADSLAFAANRVIDTLIGIAVGVLVNLIPARRPTEAEAAPDQASPAADGAPSRDAGEAGQK